MNSRFPEVTRLCILLSLGGAGQGIAQSVSEALDTPSRPWQLTSVAGMSAVSTTDPAMALDGVDALVFESAVEGAEARLSTTIVGPAMVRWRQGGQLQVGLGSDAKGLVVDSVLFAVGPQVLVLSVRGTGVLDQVEIFDSSVPVTLAAALDGGGVIWTSVGPGAWRVLSDSEDPQRQLLLSPRMSQSSVFANRIASLRAAFTGSRRLQLVRTGAPGFTLTEEFPEARPLNGWAVPGDGPHTVRLDFTHLQGTGSHVLIESVEFVEPELIGPVMGMAGVTWATGSQRPWLVRTDASGPQLSSATVRGGETSWLEARVTGPGVFQFRSDQWDLNQHLSTIWRIDGVAAPLISTAGRINVAHLPAGDHVLRWEASAPDQSRVLDTVITLRDLQWSPSTSPSLADVLPADGVTPWAWVTAGCGVGLDWMPATDGPQLALTKTSECEEPLRWLVPGPGTVSARWRTTGTAPDSARLTGPKLASYGANPSGFYEWTEVLGAVGAGWPVVAGQAPTVLAPTWAGHSTGAAAVWLDDLSWAPATAVAIEEALDHPGRLWTVGGSAPDLILGAAAPVVQGANGNDAVVISGLRDGDTAWMETTIQGPASFLLNVAATHRGVRLLVDGVAVGHVISPDYASTSRAAFLAPQLNIPLSAGSHTLRFEAHGRPSWRSGDVVMLDKMSVIGATVASVGEMVDTGDRAWAAHGFSLASLSGGPSHDGSDALSLAGSGDTMLATQVSGPGLLTLWWRSLAGVGPGAGLRVTVDGRDTIPLFPSETAWSSLVLPIPDGTHEVAFRGSGSGQRFALDEVAFTPVASVPLAQALDLAVGGFEAGALTAVASAALPTLAADGSDAVVLFDRWLEGRIQWQPPGPGRLVLKARSLSTQGSYIRIGDADDRSVSFIRFETFDAVVPAALTPLTITVSGAPLVLDQFIFIPDGPGSPQAMRYYESWLGTQGLTAAQAPPDGDHDGDGVSNGVEQAFGLLATVPDAGRFSTEAERGLPRVTPVVEILSGLTYLEVSLLGPAPGGTPQMSYRVEVSEGEGPADTLIWHLSPVTMTFRTLAGGLARFHWRSPDPIVPGRHQFVRVRATLE